MKKNQTLINLESQLKEHILFLDGAMGTYLRSLISPEKIENCDALTLLKPQLVYKTHLDYLQAGANIIETNTLCSTQSMQKKYGQENQIKALNFNAAQLAKKACNEYRESFPSAICYVAGAIGPTSLSLSALATHLQLSSFNELKKDYYEQIEALDAGGVDIFLFETFHDLMNLQAALEAFSLFEKHKQEKQPLIISFTLSKQMTDLGAVWNAIKHYGPLAIGLNCVELSSSTEKALRDLADLCAHSQSSLCFYPNAGIVESDPLQMALKVEEYAQNGLLNIIGGCCGTTPELTKLLVNKCKRKKPRNITKDSRFSDQ